MRNLVCFLLVAVAAQISFATVIHVPSEQPTIQAGIDAAVDGDTVLVANGTYTGGGNRDIDFTGKQVLVMSASGAQVTTIDCEGSAMESHIAFSFHSSETRQTIIDGFTITGAYVTDLWSDSGAVRCYSSSPTIRNCVITGNACTGVRSIRDSSPRLENCIISANGQHGIHVANLVWPISGLEMYGCTVWGNGQSGLYVQTGYQITVSNCTFVENGSDGIMFEGDPPKQGGIDDWQTKLENSLVAYNDGAGIARVMWYPGLEFYCNDSYGNDGGNYMNVDAYAGDTNGNLSLPPLFCDT
ncbi:MAG: right-handed parallel beta-helix repeat-containing protein, partial [candidate division Zixibacteria bacterium]|nr:right-handed parallel beta-helix repeat-containing protein [candidate division Zixibacteria bacterium]